MPPPASRPPSQRVDGTDATQKLAILAHLACRESRFSKIGGEMVPHLSVEEAVNRGRRNFPRPSTNLHTRAGYGGAALARFFKLPRRTAYGWISWFESLPEGLQAGILAFMDTQVPMMAACQVPAVMPKAEGGSTPVSAPPGQPSPRRADMGSGKGPSGGEVPVVRSA